MSTDINVTLIGRGSILPDSAMAALRVESGRLAALFDDYNPASSLSRLQGMPGETLYVETETWDVLEEAVFIRKQSRGAFDFALHKVKQMWGLEVGEEGQLPDSALLDSLLRGRWQDRSSPSQTWDRPLVTLADSAHVVLQLKETPLDLGGIAKGYIVDRMHDLLRSMGFSAFLIQAGGDTRVGGQKDDGPWRLGVRHPRRPDTLLGVLESTEPMAVSTSGDYERFFLRDGKRYHHLFDPQTGQPAGEVVSATVIAQNSMRADALSTTLFVLGPEQGAPVAAALAVGVLWVRERDDALCWIAQGLAESPNVSWTSGLPACEGT